MLAGQTAAAEAARPRQTSSTASDDTGDVQLTLRNDLQTVASDALGGQGGLGRRARPTHGRRPGDVQQPELRPEHRSPPRLRRGPGDAGALLTPTREAAARQRLPGALHAGLDVQGDHHGDRPREPAWSTSTRSSSARRRGRRRRRPTRSRTTAARSAAATYRGVPAQLQHPVRPDRLEPRRRGHGRPAPTPGARRAGARSTCPARRRAFFGRLRRPRPATCPLLAMRGFGQNEVQWRRCTWRWSPPTVANGGVMMKPYVVAETTRQRGRTCSSTDTPQVVADADAARDGGHAERADVERRAERHGRAAACSSTTASRRPPRRARPSSTGRPPRSVARVDHRLRPGRGTRVRDRRDRQGVARGQRRHRRHGRRARRQAVLDYIYDVAGPASVEAGTRTRTGDIVRAAAVSSAAGSRVAA